MMKKILLYLISLVFSSTIVLTLYIDNNVLGFIHYFKFDYIFFIPTIILSIIIYIIFKYLLTLLSKIEIRTSSKVWNHRTTFICSFVSILLTGLLFLLTFYPGTCMVDTLQLLADPVGYSFQYPLLYSLFFSKLYYFFYSVFGSMNVAFFLISLIQLIFMTTILSYLITWSHKVFKSNIFTLLTIIYFNICTIFTNLNSANLRDTLFAAFILLLIPLLYEIINTKGNCLSNASYKRRCIIIMGFLLIIRNNGLFMVFILLVILLMKYRQPFKDLLFIFICVLFIYNIPYLLPLKYHKPRLFQESVAIPLQQVAYTLKYDDLSTNEVEYLNNIMPNEIMKDFYDPFSVDSIKWDIMFDRFYLNDTKDQFLSIWFKNIGKHFQGYTKAYLLSTYDLWSIHRFSNYESRFLEIDFNDTNIVDHYKQLKNKSLLPTDVALILTKYYEKSTIFVNNGTLFWIYVFLGLIIYFKHQKKYLLLFVPFLSIWLNLMVATPLSSAFRYMCVFGYALPFMILVCFFKRVD